MIDDDPFASLAQDMLQLEQIGETTFRSDHNHDNTRGSVFGGQFLAQSLLAAQRTTPGWPAHSSSAYFMRPGRFDSPIIYEVELVRDGRSFANRRVVARQSDRVLFDSLCSFHPPEDGLSHQIADLAGLPDVDELPQLQDYLRAKSHLIPPREVEDYFRPLPVQFRLIDPDRVFHLEGMPEPRRDFWMRFPSARRIDDISQHQALIAFISDFWLGPVVNEPHFPPYPRRSPVVTISHSTVFHRSARADDWLLYRVDSPFAGDGIGFTRGLLHDRQGRLVASTIQEVLMRNG